MKSHLTYRIPGEEIVRTTGSFVPISDLENFEGFIVSDFEGEHFFAFQEAQENLAPADEQWSTDPLVVSKDDYLRQAKQFIHSLKEKGMGKAILSRIKEVIVGEGQRDLLFNQLEANYPNAFCYLIECPKLGTWIGATPEKLIYLDEGRASTMALAGTRPTQEINSWENKERTEQVLVTRYISEVLAHFSDEVVVSDRKELVAGPVTHLMHEFNFTLNQWPSPDFLAALHPTPAVSGFPKEQALELIQKIETHERRLYAGIIGWIGKKKTRLFVNLRCAQLIGSKAYLYVGGGLTPESDPDDEWIETENKALTLLNVWQNK